MQENLRELSNKTALFLKTAGVKVLSAVKNSAYILIPLIMLLCVGIIALTQETEPPFQAEDYIEENEEDINQDFLSNYEPSRIIPRWVKPARWFRSNSGGMPIEEVQSRIAALRGEYALVIDFTTSDELPEYLLDFFDESFFIETRALYKEGKESRVQWIFRDENYGVRLNAVIFEAKKDEESEKLEKTGETPAQVETADDSAVAIAVSGATSGEEIAVTLSETYEDEVVEKPARKPDPESGFIEIYDEKYNLTTEYRYTDKGDKSKIDYFYKNNVKVSAQAMLWDNEKEEYIETHTDYYYYNRSAFLRAVERVFARDQKITLADNVIAGNTAEEAVADSAGTDNAVASNIGNVESVADSAGTDVAATDNVVADSAGTDNAVADGAITVKADTKEAVTDNIIRVTFPHNILAAANDKLSVSEKYNQFPDFFGDLFVTKDSKLVFKTDDKGKVLEQTLVGNDEEGTVIWKIVNTWANDRIEKITKTEGETVLLAEYVYNKNGERILERNYKDGVLERVVRSEGNKDIEELYLDNKLVLQAIWVDGRKISESRVTKN